MTPSVCIFVLFCGLISPLFVSSEERRLLQGDPTLVDNEIQQLKTMVSSLTAKVAEQGREIATLRTKGNYTANPVAFTACHTLAAILPLHQTVVYNLVLTNVGNAYTPQDGHFQAPVAGLYSFSLTGMGSHSTEAYLGIMKNGARLVRIYTTTDNADSASITVHLQLSKGDRIWIENAGSAIAQLNDGEYNCFSGILNNAL